MVESDDATGTWYRRIDDGSGVFLTASSAVKGVVGAGILTLSWSFCFSSFWPGLFFTVLMGALAGCTYYLLGMCSEATGEKEYSAIWAQLCGKDSAWVVDVAILLYCALSVVSYLIIIGDYMPKGLKGLGVTIALFQNRHFCIIFMSVLILPLNMLRDVSFLGYTSLFGTVGALYTCGMLVALVPEIGYDADWEPFTLQPGIFVTIPAVTFAYNGHFNAPVLYQQLSRRSPKRWGIVTIACYTICGCITVACAASGYLMLGTELVLPDRSNVLNAPVMQPLAVVKAAYMATTLSVLFCIPLYLHSTRGALMNLYVNHIAPGPVAKESNATHLMFSAVVVVVTLAMALVLTNLGLVVAINGAVCATLIMLVFPGFMYLKCIESSTRCATTFIPLFVIIVGVVVCVAGVITTLMDSFGETHLLRW